MEPEERSIPFEILKVRVKKKNGPQKEITKRQSTLSIITMFIPAQTERKIKFILKNTQCKRIDL